MMSHKIHSFVLDNLQPFLKTNTFDIDELAVKPTIGKKLSKNLLKNPCAADGLEGWEVTSNGGAGFTVEAEAGGCKPLQEFNAGAKRNSCWATSHSECAKKQLIDLGSEGFDGDYMDTVKPKIKISEWYGSRSDAGCKYWLKVRLLNGDMEEVDSRSVNEEKDASGDWFEVSESFTGYGEGVRFVEYAHGGSDSCFWAGHFGVKFTCSSVKVMVKEKSASSSYSSSSSDDDE